MQFTFVSDLQGAPVDLGFIHRFIRGKNLRVLLLLHGTGGDENDLASIGKLVDSGASLLSPRGKILENGLTRFFKRFDEGVFDVDDLKFRTKELAEFILRASKAYRFDQENVIALGYSNGANIAASLLLLRPETVRGAILFRSMLPFYPDRVPNLSMKSVFMSSGQYDPITPRQKVIELAELLKKSGASVTLNWVDFGHSLTNHDIEGAKRWLTQL